MLSVVGFKCCCPSVASLCYICQTLSKTLPGIELSWQIVSCDSVPGKELILNPEFMAMDHPLLQLIKSKSLAFGPA